MRGAFRAIGRAASLPRPTRTAALLFSLAVLLELLGRLVDSTPITIAAAAALGAVIGDAALTPRIDTIDVSRHAPSRMTAGVETSLRVVLANPSRRRTYLAPMLLGDNHPALGELRVLTPSLRRGNIAVVDVLATPGQRGFWASGGEDTVVAHSPLGGFIRQRAFPITAPVWVHPAPARPLPLPHSGHGATSGTAGSNRSGQGQEFYGIREWRSGDGSGNVHWRASARRNQLVVMEREQPAHAAMVIVIGSAVSGEVWELTLARGAATAVAATRRRQPVTLVCGDESISPDSEVDVLDWFAALGPAAGFVPATVASAIRRLEPGATVLWLGTEAVPEEAARLARAASVPIVAIDPADGRLVQR
jgi:uncharacterized protein (DUF58 family)